MILQPLLLESVPSYLSTKERLELRRGVLAGFYRSHSSSSLCYSVTRLYFDDSSLNDLVGLDLLDPSLELQERRESIPGPRLQLRRRPPPQPTPIQVLGGRLVLPVQLQFNLAAVMYLFSFHGVRAPARSIVFV